MYSRQSGITSGRSDLSSSPLGTSWDHAFEGRLFRLVIRREVIFHFAPDRCHQDSWEVDLSKYPKLFEFPARLRLSTSIRIWMMQGMWHIYALVFMPERMAIQKIVHPNYWKMMRKNNTKVWCFISDYSSSPAPSKGEQQLELVLVFRGIQKCDGYSKAYDTPRVHIFQHLFSNPSGTRNPDENSPKSPRLPLPRHQLFADRNVDPRPGSSIWLAAFLKSHGCRPRQDGWRVIERDKLKVI